MDDFVKARLVDRFTSAELVELLAVDVEDVIWMIEELNYADEEALVELEEIMGVKHE